MVQRRRVIVVQRYGRCELWPCTVDCMLLCMIIQAFVTNTGRALGLGCGNDGQHGLRAACIVSGP